MKAAETWLPARDTAEARAAGNAAALRAGRRLADPAAVDQAVMREVRRFEAARDRMRAALIPYITSAS